MRTKSLLAGMVLLLCANAQAGEEIRRDEGIGFYVGVDNLATLSGAYAGLPNPNFDRLTLLFEHGNHYHGIGTYSLVGPAPHPGVVSTNSNNRIPETYTGDDPLPLAAGSGLYADALRSAVGPSEYSFLGIASVQTLAGYAPGSPEDVLFHSSGDRWSRSLGSAVVGLQLVSATAGLHVGTDAVKNLFESSDTILLGAGNTFEFKPVYWVGNTAAAGTYSATFRLVDLAATGPLANSGEFHFDFAVAAPVPEPELYAMLALGLPLVAWAARRRKGG